jgi:hypothetical protein
MSEEKWKHPELQEGEVFIGNGFGLYDLDRINYKTKRMGDVAYDKDGNPLTIVGYKPYFAQRSEVESFQGEWLKSSV